MPLYHRRCCVRPSLGTPERDRGTDRGLRWWGCGVPELRLWAL